MKRSFLIFLGCLCTFSCMKEELSAIEAEELTYELLANSIFTDHVKHFNTLFQQVKVDHFLEFGVGYGTKFFLDQCQEVTSCEIVLPSQTDEWMQNSRELYKNYSNWRSILKMGSAQMQAANDLYVNQKKDAALYDATYLIDLKNYCDELFSDRHFDLAFVDPGFHMRGDLVNELFDRVDIIAAHDTALGSQAYGWYKIHTPSNYVKIHFSQGQGLTFWVSKKRADVIHALAAGGGNVLQNAQRKSLRVFFPPHMHLPLMQSMALTLQYLGHTLVVPGESFMPGAPNRGVKLPYHAFFKKNTAETPFLTSFFSDDPNKIAYFLRNVEVIENDEFFKNPPDVLVVNCKEVEQSIYRLRSIMRRRGIKKTKVVHLSGNNNTLYNPRWVRNLIAIDAYTAQNYNPSIVQNVVWIPWVDFARLPFQGETDSKVIHSYLGAHYQQAFKASSAIFQDIVARSQFLFPNVSIRSIPDMQTTAFVKHAELPELINQSCATLHVKETEGFGFTIVESLAKGRPLFLKRSFSQGSRLMNWCIEGKTAFFFDDYEELQQKLQRYLSDNDYRYQIQQESAVTVRRLIDNEKQARILDQFLQNLK